MIMFPKYNNTVSDYTTTNSIFEGYGILPPALKTFVQGMTGTFLLPYMVLCLPANLWVVWLITHGTKDSLAAELFHLNTAICETLFLAGSPLHLYFVFDPAGLSLVVGTLVNALWVLICFGRPLFQCSICVERYLAVIHPLTFIRFKPLRFRAVCSGLMWFVVTVTMSSIWTADREIMLIIAFLLYVMTLSVIVFCCLSLLWSLKQPGPVETERTGGNNMKRRAFSIISLNLGIILVTYLPFMVVLYFNSLPLDTFVYLYFPTLYMILLGGIAQPLLYLHKAGKLPRKCFVTAVKPK